MITMYIRDVLLGSGICSTKMILFVFFWLPRILQHFEISLKGSFQRHTQFDLFQRRESVKKPKVEYRTSTDCILIKIDEDIMDIVRSFDSSIIRTISRKEQTRRLIYELKEQHESFVFTLLKKTWILCCHKLLIICTTVKLEIRSISWRGKEYIISS